MRRCFGQDQEILAVGQLFLDIGKMCFSLGDERGRLFNLCQGAGGLGVSDLQVIAKMAVGVFVIIAGGQGAKLPIESLATGIVAAGGAVAVSSPVAEAFCDCFQFWVIGKDGAAFSHGDVMGGIEAQCADIPKGAHHLASVGGAQRVAAVFNQPEPVFFAQGRNLIQVIGIAQGVGQHDGLGLRRDGGLDQVGVDVVCAQMNVNEYRDGTKLNNGIDCRREAGSDADHFIPGQNSSFSQLGAGQGIEGNQIGRRSGIDRNGVVDPQKFRQILFELRVESACRQPAIQHRFNHQLQLFAIDQLARGRNG